MGRLTRVPLSPIPVIDVPLVDSQRPAIRVAAIMEYPRSPASVRFDAGELDHLGPFFGFVGDELAKLGGRADKWCASEVSQPRLDFGIGEARVDPRVELVDDLGWRGLGCADAEPIACLVPRQEFPQARDVRQGLRARLGRHRERAQSTSPDIFDW